MVSWDYDAAWDNDHDDSSAGRFQAAKDRGFMEQLRAGVVPPEGWVRPKEPVCKVCWYVLVGGVCVKGCTSLSGRARAGTMADERHKAARPESDEKAAA